MFLFIWWGGGADPSVAQFCRRYCRLFQKLVTRMSQFWNICQRNVRIHENIARWLQFYFPFIAVCIKLLFQTSIFGSAWCLGAGMNSHIITNSRLTTSNHPQISPTIPTISNHLQPSSIISNHLQPSSTISNYFQPSPTIFNYLQPSLTAYLQPFSQAKKLIFS